MITLLIILLIPALIVIALYNLLVGRRNAVSNAYSTIDVYLKNRYDLIPNLVASVKTYMEHEANTLTRITELRSRLMQVQLPPGERLKAEGELSGLLSRLLMVSENYPELKANENFIHLQRSLTEMEERISAARRAYNAAVTDYNNALGMFPTNIIANIFSFKPAEWFEVPQEERKAPDVKALFK
ncbi:MAG: LemA family protein [Aquificaceae bacterium]|nr:LemA family protein [Aquificaceae bacterium]MDW8236956.1 LemA family protein [Aquificaceae bacterium]